MKKLLAFCVAILLLLPNSVLLCGAAAEDVEFVTVETDVVEAVRFDPQTQVPMPSGDVEVSNRFFGANADTPYTFYMYLTEWQKDVYNAVLKAGLASADNVNGIDITFSTPFTCESATQKITDEAKNELKYEIKGGLSALMDDHPELFWLGDYTMTFQYYSTPLNGVYRITIEQITFISQYDTAAYADQAAVTDCYNRMMAACEAFPIEGFTRYEKLKSIHDNIAKQVAYDTTFTNPTAHHPTSVFLEPYLPVCEGYAEAFKMLCDREKIPCILVVGKSPGGGHVWNYVKMEDGNWYAVDLTWDDGDSEGIDIYYDYFLTGAKATNRYFGRDSTTFADEHTNTGVHFKNCTFALQYPTLSENAYTKMIINYSADAAVNRADKIVLIGKTQTLNTAFAAPYGYTVSVSGNTTGGSLTVKENDTTVETYTVARRGDVVADNAVNKTDYNKIARTAVGAERITGKAQTAAADMNSDGVVDAFDAALMDLYLNDCKIY